MIQPLTKKLIQQLRKSELTLEDRVALITALLDKLGVLPIGDVIDISEQGISIQGKVLDQEQVLNFKEASAVLRDNFARQVINEQIRYKAIDLGINKATAMDTLFFAKAALWCLNEQEILITQLSTL